MKVYAKIDKVFYGEVSGGGCPIRSFWLANIRIASEGEGEVLKFADSVIISKNEPTKEDLENGCREAIQTYKDELIQEAEREVEDARLAAIRFAAHKRANKFNQEIKVKGEIDN